jgi:hypothetical protein
MKRNTWQHRVAKQLAVAAVAYGGPGNIFAFLLDQLFAP